MAYIEIDATLVAQMDKAIADARTAIDLARMKVPFIPIPTKRGIEGMVRIVELLDLAVALLQSAQLPWIESIRPQIAAHTSKEQPHRG
jgi:hypothetical protein